MKRKNGFTLIELLVVVAIIAVLVAMLLPALTQAREAAKTTVCSAKLKQLGIGIQIYTDMNNGVYPQFYMTPPSPPVYLPSWEECFAKSMMLGNEESAREYLHCPSDPATYNSTDPDRWHYWTSYGGNQHLGYLLPYYTHYRVDAVSEPIRVMLLVDSTLTRGWNCINIWADAVHAYSLHEWLDWRHPSEKGFNILFCDGHVSNYQPEDYKDFQQYIVP